MFLFCQISRPVFVPTAKVGGQGARKEWTSFGANDHAEPVNLNDSLASVNTRSQWQSFKAPAGSANVFDGTE